MRVRERRNGWRAFKKGKDRGGKRGVKQQQQNETASGAETNNNKNIQEKNLERNTSGKSKQCRKGNSV